MGPFEMVIGIVLIATVGSIIRAKLGMTKDKYGNETLVDRGAARAEKEALMAEIRGLKERISVLERVITDNHSTISLDREIEKLRDPGN